MNFYLFSTCSRQSCDDTVSDIGVEYEIDTEIYRRKV